MEIPRGVRVSNALHRFISKRVTRPLMRRCADIELKLLYEQCELCGKWQRGGTRQFWDFITPEHSFSGFKHDINLCTECFKEGKEITEAVYKDAEWIVLT